MIYIWLIVSNVNASVSSKCFNVFAINVVCNIEELYLAGNSPASGREEEKEAEPKGMKLKEYWVKLTPTPSLEAFYSIEGHCMYQEQWTFSLTQACMPNTTLTAMKYFIAYRVTVEHIFKWVAVSNAMTSFTSVHCIAESKDFIKKTDCFFFLCIHSRSKKNYSFELIHSRGPK